MAVLYRARAPLRMSLAGGGTDIATYSDKFGGAVLNATISMYAHAAIEPLDTDEIILHAVDRGEEYRLPAAGRLDIDDKLPLHKGCYNSIVEHFTGKKLGFRLTTYVDAPPGSGLGSSSTLVVAMLAAFSEWLQIPLGEYDLASLAYKIEREDLNMAGGKQDQYTASFGGVNFIEFSENGSVLVNPLRIKDSYLKELERDIVLYYTSVSRVSSDIIQQQKDIMEKESSGAAPGAASGGGSRLEAMHELKEQAYRLKAALLRGELLEIGRALRKGWESKKKTADSISSPLIEKTFATALDAGALGGKISGAGGGGFAVFFCPGYSRFSVIEALAALGGEFRRFEFVQQGVTAWKGFF